MNKKPYVPLPQPKPFVSQQQKDANRKAQEAKRKLGMRGKTEPGDMISKAKSLKLSVAGLI